MQKNKGAVLLRITVISALLCAISIVLGKYLAINVGDVIRISFENLPVLLAGMAFGPLVGALVGCVGDLLGCLLVGYAVNPLVTLGASLVGAISGLYRIFPKRSGGVSRFLAVLLTVFSAHAIGSVVVKTIGLSAFYAMDLGVLMLWRALNYLIVGSAEVAVLYLLTKSTGLVNEIKKINGGIGL